MTCSCGRIYTLASMPERCACGVGIFGAWARVNAKASEAANAVQAAGK